MGARERRKKGGEERRAEWCLIRSDQISVCERFLVSPCFCQHLPSFWIFVLLFDV